MEKNTATIELLEKFANHLKRQWTRRSTYVESIDIKDGIIAFALRDQFLSGGSVEYASILGIIMDGKVTWKRFIYRDPDDEKKDDWLYQYKKIEIKEVNSDEVIIEATSPYSHWPKKYAFKEGFIKDWEWEPAKIMEVIS